MTIAQDIQTLEPGARIELFEIDMRSIGGDQLFFHPHRQSTPIIWQGNEYIAYPVQASGFERTGDQQPRPTLDVANVNGMVTALCIYFQDLVGATVIRRRTLKQYLDAANFPDGNPSADPDEHFRDEIWRIEQKSNENKTSATFVLASPLDFESQMLPDRQVLANHCAWLKRGGYRGPYCGYTGPAVATLDDTPTDDPAADRCGGRLRSCKFRFGETQPLRFGAFPSSGKVRQ